MKHNNFRSNIYSIQQAQTMLSYNTGNFKLQLVIKHQQNQDHHQPRYLPSTPFHMSCSQVSDLLFLSSQPTELSSPYNEPMPSSTLLSTLHQHCEKHAISSKKSSTILKRSQSAKKSSNYFQQNIKKESSLKQRVMSSRVHIVNQKNDPKHISLRGHSARKNLQKNRPFTSCHDLNLRMHDKYRPDTAMTSARTNRSKPTQIEAREHFPKSILSARKHKRVMSVNPSKQFEEQYKKKLKNFFDYIFKVNYSNGIYIELALLPVLTPLKKYKVYVQKGNNSSLVRYILKRRFWIDIVESLKEQCSCYWTNAPESYLHQKQTKSNKFQEQNKKDQFAKDTSIQNSPTILKSQFKFRRELGNSKKQLNRKFMTEQQAAKVETLIENQGYSLFRSPYTFPFLTNRISGVQCLTTRKQFYLSIKTYFQDVIDQDPVTIIPKTFFFTELKGYTVDFFKHVVQTNPKKLWIIKPGENTLNCEGIQILPGPKVLSRIQERWQEQEETLSFVVQDYIENHLLYYERKFDIRHFMLLTCINGHLKAFWYLDGYIRTASKQFPLVTKIKCRNPQAKKFKNQFNQQQGAWLKKTDIHFTNDYLQSQSEDYGKYEAGNKLSYGDFQKYLDLTEAQYPFRQKTVVRMKEISTSILKAVKGKIDPDRKACNFELLALDFIMQQDFEVKLIQVQRNPQLESQSPILGRVIPELVEQTVRFCVDPLLPPKNHYPAGERHSVPTDYLAAQKWELFYEQ